MSLAEKRSGDESSLASVDDDVAGVRLNSKGPLGFDDRDRDDLDDRLTTLEWRLDFLDEGDRTFKLSDL